MLKAEGAGAPQFLFFARHYNDIDHTAPVIWGLLRKGVDTARIRYTAYVADPSIEPRRDARLAFLAQRGVVLETPYLDGGLRSIFHRVSAAPLGKTVRRKARKILFRKLVRKDDALDHALNVVREAPNNSVVITDHALGEETNTILDAARERGFPTVALPHGFQFHFGFTDPNTEKALAPPCEATISQCFDHMLVSDAWQKQIATKGKEDTGKVKVIGLPRFDPEWVEQLCSMYPVKTERSNRFRVLMLLEKAGLKINGVDVEWLNVDEQFRVVEYLAQHRGVDLCIKSNARGVSYRQSRRLRSYRRYLAEDATPTTQLISWADLSVGCGSSVLMDAYVRGKAVLFLEYAIGVHMAHKKFGFYKNPQSFTEFKAKLEGVLEGGAKKLYAQQHLNNMIQYYVYGGSSPHSVVDACASFLEQLPYMKL